MILQERKSKVTVIVVLREIKAAMEKTGVAPLIKVLRDVVGPKDEIVVLGILEREAPSPTMNTAVLCCLRDHRGNNKPSVAEPYVMFLHEEISRRKEVYRQILRPFYEKCKSNGVKFQVKISATCQPKDVIVEEANKAKATLIVMDRCFARDLTFQLSGTNCNVTLVSEEEDEENKIDTDLEPNPKRPLIIGKESLQTQEEPRVSPSMPEIKGEYRPFSPSIHASGSKGSDNPTTSDPYVEKGKLATKGTDFYDNMPSSSKKPSEDGNVELGLPLHLRWEVIEGIISGFTRNCIYKQENLTTFNGILANDRSLVLVKKLQGDCDDILKAEKKAAFSMCHRNILKLIGYHERENTTFLVFPYAERGTLDKYLCEVNCGVERLCATDPSNHESMKLVKSDVFSFGVLLLRLFCQRSAPHNDRALIEWARPLVLLRAFHELLDEEREDPDLDIHEFYRVMCAAAHCTRTNPISRPCMGEVLLILKGEIFCAMQSSPSTDNSNSNSNDEAELLHRIVAIIFKAIFILSFIRNLVFSIGISTEVVSFFIPKKILALKSKECKRSLPNLGHHFAIHRHRQRDYGAPAMKWLGLCISAFSPLKHFKFLEEMQLD
ncbi:hypothetical protein L1049_004265 [Liquidambar formosana]|uniref:Protein kinase domain-containing protein n=1 Tax=Liquidambar formosana TaxID=63359 RepID=A0AAP0X034_LIQFO